MIDPLTVIALMLAMFSLGTITGHGIGYARAMRIKRRTTYEYPTEQDRA